MDAEDPYEATGLGMVQEGISPSHTHRALERVGRTACADEGRFFFFLFFLSILFPSLTLPHRLVPAPATLNKGTQGGERRRAVLVRVRLGRERAGNWPVHDAGPKTPSPLPFKLPFPPPTSTLTLSHTHWHPRCRTPDSLSGASPVSPCPSVGPAPSWTRFLLLAPGVQLGLGRGEGPLAGFSLPLHSCWFKHTATPAAWRAQPADGGRGIGADPLGTAWCAGVGTPTDSDKGEGERVAGGRS